MAIDQTLDDTPLAGVTVKLYDSYGRLVGSTTTDADGVYIFSHLKMGTYKLEIVLPKGYTTDQPLTMQITLQKGSLIQVNIYARKSPISPSSASVSIYSIIAALSLFALLPQYPQLHKGSRRFRRLSLARKLIAR
jgi:uncharacterized surface anchored protein